MFFKKKVFGGREIIIRSLNKDDIKLTSKFQNHLNCLVKEDAQILINETLSLKQEREWLKGKLNKIKKCQTVLLAAFHRDKIVGVTDIDLDSWRRRHIGNFGIAIRSSYRGIGLGNYLMEEIVKLAKKELKPKPKIIKLSVFSTNKPAIKLYEKQGFKKVAEIPRQYQYKGKFVNEIIMLLYLK